MELAAAGSYRVLLKDARHETFSDEPFLVPAAGSSVRAGDRRRLDAVRAVILSFLDGRVTNRPAVRVDDLPKRFLICSLPHFVDDSVTSFRGLVWLRVLRAASWRNQWLAWFQLATVWLTAQSVETTGLAFALRGGNSSFESRIRNYAAIENRSASRSQLAMRFHLGKIWVVQLLDQQPFELRPVLR
jgi:hypothetical protein